MAGSEEMLARVWGYLVVQSEQLESVHMGFPESVRGLRRIIGSLIMTEGIFLGHDSSGFYSSKDTL